MFCLEQVFTHLLWYFPVEQGKDAEELTAVARQEDGIWFYMTGDVDIAKVFGLNKKAPALVLLKKQEWEAFNVWYD